MEGKANGMSSLKKLHDIIYSDIPLKEKVKYLMSKKL